MIIASARGVNTLLNSLVHATPSQVRKGRHIIQSILSKRTFPEMGSKEESLRELAHPEYWDARYSKDDADAKVYDWLRHFDALEPFLTKHLPPVASEPEILHLGSGNSVSLYISAHPIRRVS